MTAEGHAVAFFCAYCGEEDLEPDGDEGGRWHCHSCTRTFVVKLVRPANRSPESVRSPAAGDAPAPEGRLAP